MNNRNTSSRRDFLRLLGVGAAAMTLARSGAATHQPASLRDSTWLVRLVDGTELGADALELRRDWGGPRCRLRLRNKQSTALPIREIVVFSGPHGWDSNAGLYGESFQMLSQTEGTLGAPVKLGFDEARHYRLPETAGAITVRSLLLVSPRGSARELFAFASCRRFAGEFRIFPGRLDVVMDAEGRTLAAGAEWELEDFFHGRGGDREQLLGALAAEIERAHPRRGFPQIPTGWCSWYYYSKSVTEDDILANLRAIAADRAHGVDLRFIQIDDGYQPAHGDWLDPNPKFPSGIAALCRKIRDQGFEPAIWVAPFIASPRSRLLRERPDWFVQADGQPLAADRVTFAGWNDQPWYLLDATIPEVQQHLEHVFRVMRNDWGCTYFKLDANFWGAVHGSRYRDANATRIENYRRGMAAIIRGAGEGSFILGCNAPMWASLGLVDGMRVTGDIKRDWHRFVRCARENFHRNWQHGRLWMNDPDCIVVSKRIKSRAAPIAAVTDDEMRFHATAIMASGGMLLNGDDYTGLTAGEKAVLRKTLPPTGHPARFTDDQFAEGRAELPDGRTLVFVFNWSDRASRRSVRFARACPISDFWSGESLGRTAHLDLGEMPPHSARMIVATFRG